MSAIEAVATVLGIACVALAALRSVWTFPVGIASVVLVGIVVFEARLYSDAALQIFFVAANLYGWRMWSSARVAGEVPVGTMTVRARWHWLVAGIAAAIGWGGTMRLATDAAYPWWDAGIAVASVAAQLLMARRRIENWWIWIAVDVASVPIYLAKHLYGFAGLYVVYLALSILGLKQWRATRP